jgi:UDP-N-acetyl-D-mannosaminuronic acid dehydrogenase
VNDAQPEFVVGLTEKALGVLTGKRIAVLGLAFKPDVDDLRESPAVEVAYRLSKAGVTVTAFEPYKPEFVHEGIVVCPTLEETVKGADAILLLVNHAQFRSIDSSILKKLTAATVIIDTVNGWNLKDWKLAGFKCYRLGDGKNLA